jgi:hypothetical protein
MFFFEKKNQKTFAILRVSPSGATALQKFFASFFSKKKRLACAVSQAFS